MDADILKPDTGETPFERPSQINSKQTSAEGSSGVETPDGRDPGYTEPVSEGEEDEEMDLAPAKNEYQRAGLSGAEVDEAIAFRERMLKERQQPEFHELEEGSDDERTPFLKTRRASSHALLNKPRTFSIDPLAPSSAFDVTLRDRLKENAARANESAMDADDEEEEEERDDPLLPPRPSDERILSRDFAAPPGKLIAVPVRIEPKVYFASERTFLVSIL